MSYAPLSKSSKIQECNTTQVDSIQQCYMRCVQVVLHIAEVASLRVLLPNERLSRERELRVSVKRKGPHFLISGFAAGNRNILNPGSARSDTDN